MVTMSSLEAERSFSSQNMMSFLRYPMTVTTVLPASLRPLQMG